MTANRYGLAALLESRSLFRLGGIAAGILTIAGSFAWAGGWLDRGWLDQSRIIDRFEAVNGPHAGFRRNHAKGVCLTGWFDSNGAGARYSKAALFEAGRFEVVGRFALAGGMPAAADGPLSVRSMALQVTLPDGEIWRTGMNALPVFAVKDAQGFYDQLLAGKPDPATGKPDPARFAAFLTVHPETARALALIKSHPPSSGFADSAFNSLNAFRLIDGGGTSLPVRWSMVPEDSPAPEPTETPADKSYLFDALGARLAEGPIRWHLVLTLGEEGDPTGDATLPWPEQRRRIDAGTLTVEAIAAEKEGNCRDITFDPLVLPRGIAPSDDPLLSARSAAYAVSLTRRDGEDKTPSAVQPETDK